MWIIQKRAQFLCRFDVGTHWSQRLEDIAAQVQATAGVRMRLWIAKCHLDNLVMNTQHLLKSFAKHKARNETDFLLFIRMLDVFFGLLNRRYNIVDVCST